MHEKTHDAVTVTYPYQLGNRHPASPVNTMPTPNLIRSAFMYRIFTLIFVVCLAPVAIGQVPAELPLASERSTEQRSIEFSFDKADWKDVVPWFAEQAGYSWQSISGWPKGTFTLEDKQKYTPLEALDQINHALRLQKPPFTIIRNRNQLILSQASAPLPNELVETITPDELDQRGDYEIVNCRFSLGDIEVLTVEQDLRSAISPQYQNSIKVLPATNEFYARETGANLRTVRNAIVVMTRRKATTYSDYALKYQDPEQFLIMSRRLLGIPEGAYEREDGSLLIQVDPAANRLILKGTPTAIEDFNKTATLVDKSSEQVAPNAERS